MNGLIKLSRYAGLRLDLVQAGGGNSSVKINRDTILIKASGFRLADVDGSRAVCTINIRPIKALISEGGLNNLDEDEISELLNSLQLGDDIYRPSMETLFHILLGKYVLHTHPIIVNSILCNQNWESRLKNYFPDALYIKYQKPGPLLGLSIMDELENYRVRKSCLPVIIFLQNHGLIISGETPDAVMELNELVIATCENITNYNRSSYKILNDLDSVIYNHFNQKLHFSLSEFQLSDFEIKTMLSLGPLTPDEVVYNGAYIVNFIGDYNLDIIINKFKEYVLKYEHFPKVLFMDGQFIFVGDTYYQLKSVEELFLFKLKVLRSTENHGDIEALSEEAIIEILSMDSEKYRLNID